MIRYLKLRILLFLILFSGVYHIYAQENSTSSSKSTKIHFHELEFRTGKMLPTSPKLAPSGPLYSILFSFGKLNNDQDNLWARFHRFPISGITVGFTNFGAPEIYGYEVKIVPYIEYIVGKKLSYRPTIKIGLGASYTTKYFRKNHANYALGAPVNWAFELSFRQNVWTNKFGILRLGVGFIHSSDGHIQLPNAGINGLVANISFLHIPSKSNFNPSKSVEKPKINKDLYYFVQFNPIIGIHELGGPVWTKGGPKREVYGTNFMTGFVLKHGFKFYIGFGYRYYEHFDYVYQHEQHPDIAKYSSGFAFASNIYIINGLEMMYGHFGFTFEGGLNLYKPFYKTYCDLYSPETPTKFILKKYLNSRIGLKAYWYNINENPKYNFFIGAHVNANLGQADFTEISFGFLRNFYRPNSK